MPRSGKKQTQDIVANFVTSAKVSKYGFSPFQTGGGCATIFINEPADGRAKAASIFNASREV
jgi:hypothetical protein